MKIKILLTGKDASRAKFRQSLLDHVKFTQDNASLNVVGTGVYKFKLGEDDIEIFYIEDHPLLKKNFKTYAVDANGIIFVDADDETIKLLRAACPKNTPYALHVNGGEVNGMAGVNIIVKKYLEQQKALTSNPHATFKAPAQSQPDTQGASINFELMKKFLDSTPKRIL